MTKNTTVLKIIWGLFVFAVLSINAILTFQFGATYAQHAFAGAGPAAPIIGGAFLTIFYDAAAWAAIAAYAMGETREQRAIALISGIASTVASTISSILQLLLNNTLYTVPEEIVTYAGVIGILIMVTIAAMHFLSILGYTLTSKEHQEQDAEVDLKAELQSFRLGEKRTMAKAIKESVRTALAAEMPQLVAQEADGQLTILRNMLLTAKITPEEESDQAEPIIIEHEPVTASPASKSQREQPRSSTSQIAQDEKQFVIPEDSENRRGLTKDELLGLVSGLLGIDKSQARDVASLAATSPAREEVALAHDKEDTPFGQTETEDEEGKTA